MTSLFICPYDGHSGLVASWLHLHPMIAEPCCQGHRTPGLAVPTVPARGILGHYSILIEIIVTFTLHNFVENVCITPALLAGFLPIYCQRQISPNRTNGTCSFRNVLIPETSVSGTWDSHHGHLGGHFHLETRKYIILRIRFANLHPLKLGLLAMHPSYIYACIVAPGDL
jgi:hypothetical protein